MRGGTSQYRRPGIAQWLDWVAAFAICIAVSPAAAEAQEQAEFNYRSFCTLPGSTPPCCQITRLTPLLRLEPSFASDRKADLAKDREES